MLGANCTAGSCLNQEKSPSSQIRSRTPQPIFFAADKDGVDYSIGYTRHGNIAYGYCVGKHDMASPDTNDTLRSLLDDGYIVPYDVMLRKNPLTGKHQPCRMTPRKLRTVLRKNNEILQMPKYKGFCDTVNTTYEGCNQFVYNHCSQTQIGQMTKKKLVRQTINGHLRASETLALILVRPQKNRSQSNIYLFPVWAEDVSNCYIMASCFPALVTDSHFQVTPTIRDRVKDIISLLKEGVSIPISSYLVQVPNMTESWNQNSQKVKNFDQIEGEKLRSSLPMSRERLDNGRIAQASSSEEFYQESRDAQFKRKMEAYFKVRYMHEQRAPEGSEERKVQDERDTAYRQKCYDYYYH